MRLRERRMKERFFQNQKEKEERDILSKTEREGGKRDKERKILPFKD